MILNFPLFGRMRIWMVVVAGRRYGEPKDLIMYFILFHMFLILTQFFFFLRLIMLIMLSSFSKFYYDGCFNILFFLQFCC